MRRGPAGPGSTLDMKEVLRSNRGAVKAISGALYYGWKRGSAVSLPWFSGFSAIVTTGLSSRSRVGIFFYFSDTLEGMRGVVGPRPRCFWGIYSLLRCPSGRENRDPLPTP